VQSRPKDFAIPSLFSFLGEQARLGGSKKQPRLAPVLKIWQVGRSGERSWQERLIPHSCLNLA
jgi:hypothetical protein